MQYKHILEIHDLRKVYGNHHTLTKALNGITFDVLEGEFLGIMGQSGSGKSTLLNCISTIQKPTSGKIIFQDQDLTSFNVHQTQSIRGNQIGYIFQNYALIGNLTISENIILPLDIHHLSYQQERFDKIVKQLQIDHILDKYPHQVSGGEKQRTAIARCFITNPKLILADEPTGSLDTATAKHTIEQLRQMQQEKNTATILVTHDSRVASYCSRILFIEDGRIIHELRRNFQQESEQMFYERIIHVLASVSGGSIHVL